MHKAQEETILNVLDKRTKQTPTSKTSKRKQQPQKDPETEVLSKPRFLEAFSTNYQKLVQQFHLSDKKEEFDEFVETRKEFEHWATKLKCEKLSFEESVKPFNPSEHFDIDPYQFVNDFLIESTEETLLNPSTSISRSGLGVQSKFELRLQEDLEQGHKEIFKKKTPPVSTHAMAARQRSD